MERLALQYKESKNKGIIVSEKLNDQFDRQVNSPLWIID